MTRYLDARDVEELHRIVGEHAAEHDLEFRPGFLADGPRKGRQKLEQTVQIPATEVFGHERHQTIFDKAAALLETLSRNHCFIDGNKRTAILSAVTFLRLNGYELVISQPQAESFRKIWGALETASEALASADEWTFLRDRAALFFFSALLSGLVELLKDGGSDGVDWTDPVASRRYEIPWDWEDDCFSFSDPAAVDSGIHGTMQSLSDKYVHHALVRGLREATGGVVWTSNDTRPLVTPEIAEVLEPLNEPEKAVAFAGLREPVYMGRDEARGLTGDICELCDVAEKLYGVECNDPDLDRYRAILEEIDRFRGAPAIETGTLIQDQGTEDEEVFQIEPFLCIFPLRIDRSERAAYHELVIGINFPESQPKFDQLDEEDFAELHNELEKMVSELEDTADEEMDKLTDTILELSEEFGDHEIGVDTPNDAPPPIAETGSYEALWEFTVRVEEQKPPIDEIANWFEQRARPLP